MDHIFETIEYREIKMHHLAVFQLMYVAIDWWDTEKVTIGEDAARRMPQTKFKERLLGKYFLKIEKNQREKEFIELVRDMTVREYMTQFDRLS